MRDESFNIAENPKYDRSQIGIPSIVYIFFNTKLSGGAAAKKWFYVKQRISWRITQTTY